MDPILTVILVAMLLVVLWNSGGGPNGYSWKSKQFVRDRRMVLHAQSESDLELRVSEMTEAEGRRLDADESQVVEVFILDEKTVL